MTQKLYENDSYIKEFSAIVLSCQEEKESYRVVLDRTAFFAEGGGQAADTGMLGGARVLDVQQQDGEIVHTISAPLRVGEEVKGELDWEKRFLRMQNHTAEHIVSGVIHSLFGYNNVGFHMNDSLVTLDVDGPLSAEEIERVELIANKAVWDNAEVSVSTPDGEELASISCRSKIELVGGVRLVTVLGYDCCACCAPHVKSAGEIGIIKIINFYSNKGGTRIEMLAGALALRDYLTIHNATKAIMALLSAKRYESYEAVERLNDALAKANYENKALLSQLAMARLKTEAFKDAVIGFTPDASFDELRYCANSLAGKDGCVLLFSKVQDGYNYLAVSSEKDVRSIVKGLNTAFSGKGGGKPDCAQGRLAAGDPNEISAFLKSII